MTSSRDKQGKEHPDLYLEFKKAPEFFEADIKNNQESLTLFHNKIRDKTKSLVFAGAKRITLSIIQTKNQWLDDST